MIIFSYLSIFEAELNSSNGQRDHKYLLPYRVKGRTDLSASLLFKVERLSKVFDLRLEEQLLYCKDHGAPFLQLLPMGSTLDISDFGILN